MLTENTNHANSASGLPGGPQRTDGNVDVEISARRTDNESGWDIESTGSQAKIVKTTVVPAEWEVRGGGNTESETAEVEKFEGERVGFR